MTKADRVIRDGMVAVAVSPGFGAGWSTWNQISPLEPKVIEMIEAGRKFELTPEWVSENLGIDDAYCGGADDLTVEWLPVGTAFVIEEYDGSESLRTTSDLSYMA